MSLTLSVSHEEYLQIHMKEIFSVLLQQSLWLKPSSYLLFLFILILEQQLACHKVGRFIFLNWEMHDMIWEPELTCNLRVQPAFSVLLTYNETTLGGSESDNSTLLWGGVWFTVALAYFSKSFAGDDKKLCNSPRQLTVHPKCGVLPMVGDSYLVLYVSRFLGRTHLSWVRSFSWRFWCWLPACTDIWTRNHSSMRWMTSSAMIWQRPCG